MKLDWLTDWLLARFTETYQNPSPPTREWAEQCSSVLLLQWLRDEAGYWRNAARNPRLTTAQRTMRLRVAKFYEERAIALEAVESSQVVKETEEP